MANEKTGFFDYVLIYLISEKRDKTWNPSSSSSLSSISSAQMLEILEKLWYQTTRNSTAKTYYNIWTNFKKIIIKLDVKPKNWESGVSLYGAYLVDRGFQSVTIKTYVSAIKKILVNDKYKWNDNLVLLNTLTKACRLKNDRLTTRLPIKSNLLELILFELERIYQDQYYLEILYKTIFLMSFYGFLRIGEATKGDHIIN